MEKEAEDRRRVVDYTVVENMDPFEFKAQVKEHLEEGWVLQGGLVLMQGSVTPVYAQALVKYEGG